MRGNTATALVLLLFLALMPVAAAPATSQAQPLLPASFGGWNSTQPGMQALGAQAGQIAGDRTAILREYGLALAERRDYAQGAQSVSVTLYRMSDPSAAFGAFTFLRDPQMASIAVGDAAAYTAGAPNRAILVIGNLVVDVSTTTAGVGASAGASPGSSGGASSGAVGPQNVPASKNVSAIAGRPSDSDLKALADGLVRRADRRPYPYITDYLPAEGLEHGSEHYVLGPQALAQVFPVRGSTPADWIGFDKSAEAMVARYHLKGQPKDQESTLVLALYPTQQIAADRYNQLTKWFAVNADPGDSAQVNGRPVVFGTRSSALIAVLSGTQSQPAASNFLDQIHYASAVTWNEPSHELTDPSIGTMVVGAFMGTGSIMILAVAAGIGFGGFRLLTKLVLPGKVFDSDDRVEILQLGLSSKPIRTADFYSTPKT
jgi:hypothetical protein